MIINKIDNSIGILKIIISIFLSLACIYQVGTHTHLSYYFLILFLSFLKKNQLKKYLNGTFSADLVLSILFLSFSWNDYAAFSAFRSRAHVLSPILPSISLFISLIYFYELKKNNYKLSNFFDVQTSLPLIAILIGIVSGITTEINHGVEIFSSFHLLIIILFILANFFTIRIYFKKEYALIKLIPLSFFLFVILICKSKIYIFGSLISIFWGFEKIIFIKSLNKTYLKKFYKLINFLKIMLSSLFLLIILGGFNLNYIGKIAKPLDVLLTYRLSINSSLYKAFNYFDSEKFNPRFLPNKEFQLSEKLKKILNDQSLKKKRINNLSDFYDIETINRKIINKNFHNSFMYYYFMHQKIWNYLLYIFLITFSVIFIVRNQLSDYIHYFMYLGFGFLSYIPYLSFIIILITIFTCFELAKILQTNYSGKTI